jgi:hypothetical protein
VETVEVYLEALRRLKEATAAAQAVVRVVTEGARALGRWQEVVVSDIGGGAYPAEVGLRRVPGISARDWPSAEAIHNALVTFHEARVAVTHAWGAIPQERWDVLPPPPPWPN